MSVGSGGTEYPTDGADEGDGPGWDLDPEDESGAVVAAVGRQIKLWREAAELRPAELETAHAPPSRCVT